MPTTPDTSNEIIEQLVKDRAKLLETKVDSDVISFLGPLLHGAERLIRGAVENIDNKRNGIYFFLETPGGYVEPVQRIADILRYHYDKVHFVVPDHAMSSGTVLVMSGDAILMDYYSILGPIDPQVESKDGRLVSALGYLIQYDRLVTKAKSGEITTAEMAFMIEKFDPATLYRYEQERELSISLLREWLATYKFKNWHVTETRKIKVDDKMRRKRAEEIGQKLSDPERWHSHGIGITMKTLREEINLQIEDFGQDADLNNKIRQYFGLLWDYRGRRGHSFVVHTREQYTGID